MSSAGVKNAWNFNSTSHVVVLGHGDNFTFLYSILADTVEANRHFIFVLSNCVKGLNVQHTCSVVI
jgi:hypothetical protein